MQDVLSENEDLNLGFKASSAILISAIKKRVADKDFTNSLKTFLIPQNFANVLMQAFVVLRPKLEENADALDHVRDMTPGLKMLRWRTDVTVSTTSLAKIFTPSLLFQMTLSDGSIKQFECSVEKFQEWRFQTALVLRNMQAMTNHPTLVLNTTMVNN